MPEHKGLLFKARTHAGQGLFGMKARLRLETKQENGVCLLSEKGRHSHIDNHQAFPSSGKPWLLAFVDSAECSIEPSVCQV